MAKKIYRRPKDHLFTEAKKLDPKAEQALAEERLVGKDTRS